MSREYKCTLPGSLSFAHLSLTFFRSTFVDYMKGRIPFYIKVASFVLHHQANVHMLYALVLFIRDKHDECGPGMAVCIWLDTLWL